MQAQNADFFTASCFPNLLPVVLTQAHCLKNRNSFLYYFGLLLNFVLRSLSGDIFKQTRVMVCSESLIMPHATGINYLTSFLSRAPKVAGFSRIKMKKENKIEDNQEQYK